jgi:hypothetical protein
MGKPDRRQLVVERILEDEALRGDLEDRAASALISWAAERAGALAADPARSDAAVDAGAGAIRAAARAAAASSEQDPTRVIALAEAALAGAAEHDPASAESLPVTAEAARAPAERTTPPEALPTPGEPVSVPAAPAQEQASGREQTDAKPRHRRRKRLPGALR